MRARTKASPPPSPFLRLAQDKKGEGALSKNRLTIPTYPPLTTGRELNTKANRAPSCPFGKAQDEKKGELEGDGWDASTVEKKLIP